MNSLKLWTPDDFEITTYHGTLKNRKNTVGKIASTDRTGLCNYIYNELGFRGDSPSKEGFKIMSIGCSLTEGVGVDNEDTWPAQFAKLVPNGVNLNFGSGGRSNDYMARCLISYFDTIKPDLVLIMYTETHRREFYTPDGGVEAFHVDKWGYLLETPEGDDIHKSLVRLSNYEEDYQNWYKNHLLIKYFLESKKCNWLWNGWFLLNDYSDENRFDGDYYPFIDYGADDYHPGPKTNKLYVNKLHQYIKENFSKYLPS